MAFYVIASEAKQSIAALFARRVRGYRSINRPQHSRRESPSPQPSPRKERGEGVERSEWSRARGYAGTTSSLITKNFTRSIRPKLVVSATSAASRPVPIRMRPARGLLWRASNVYHWPER